MSQSIIDERSECGIPWASPQSWPTAIQAVDYHMQRYRAELKYLKILVREIKSCLNSAFPILDELCANSCQWCPDPCCLNASVWFDYKDLLFLHFNQQPIPPAQPKADLSMTCRYLGPRGCRLPRLSRPWICTWYLCPTQTANLRNGHQTKRKFLNRAMALIKSERNLLESEYIRIIS